MPEIKTRRKLCDCKRCKSRRKRYWDRRNKAIAMLGGACVRCGEVRIRELQFHHIYPETKKFGLNNGHNTTEKEYMEEAKKCVLLCCACHVEQTETQNQNDGFDTDGEDLF